MKDPIAIIETSVDECAAAVRAAFSALREAEARATKAAEKAAASREKSERDSAVASRTAEEAKVRRLELGRELVKARKAWPARGPKAKGWGELLEREGIEQQTALNYMRLAGFVDEISQTDGHVLEIPTYAEAGIDRRPRARDDQPDPQDLPSLESSWTTPVTPVDPVDEPTTPARTGGRGKPDWLMRALVRDYSRPGDLICDPLAGFGSTLIAARDEGRRSIGAEIDHATWSVAPHATGIDLRFGDWREVLGDSGIVDTIITDPPYSARTHESSPKFGNAREDGSPLDGLGPSYASWSPEDVEAFVAAWAPRCRGWMVALTDHHLIPAWEAAYEKADRYSFAPVGVAIVGMTVRLCGDGPSSWLLYAMVSRPRSLSRWATLPGAYLGTKGRELDVRDVAA